MMSADAVAARRGLAALVVVALGLLPASCGGSSDAVDSTQTDDIPTTYVVMSYTDNGSVVQLDDGSLWNVLEASRSTVLNHWNLDNQLVAIAPGESQLVDVESGGAHNVQVHRIGNLLTNEVYDHAGDNTLESISHGAYFGGGFDGGIVTLEDGSIWAINNADDQGLAIQWADGDDIVVKENTDPEAYANATPVDAPAGGVAADNPQKIEHLYTLTDTDVGTTVNATYIASA